jgi:UDP-N-acetylmuramoyl-tripeptide--D-alanyl-D-alanine ligase
MITIPLFEACVAVGGRSNKALSPNDYVYEVTQNSKDAGKGSLFVALKGNRVDGHDFILEAQQKGAVAAVVEYEVKDIQIPQFIVPSTVEALGHLGRIWRGRLNIPLIAVTGSVGKTSTKELIAHTLESKYKTHKSRKNFNNQLGVPMELLRLERDHECSVVEFGMRNINQINYLSKIARPSYAVITNIGMSHIEMLKTRENIAIAKSEILEGMDRDGVLVLNRDDDFYDFIAEKSHCRIISFGTHKDSDVRISDIELNDKAHPRFKLNDFQITMNNSVGRYHAYNAAIAYIIATEMRLSKEEIADKFASYTSPEKRGVVSFLKNGALLLDSTYSAAPDSIKASLDTISILTQQGKRTIAVIGEMVELGSHSEEAHKHIGKVIAGLKGGIEHLITVGEYAQIIGKESESKNWKHFKDTDSAAKHLLEMIKKDDIVLLQGSNRINLESIVDALENKFGVHGK